jgi:quercetin dioxygenase-like cupin family protein
MELFRRNDVKSFANSGVTSEQLLNPENSASQRVTITRVTVAPGARNPPHRHVTSEQVWVALRGAATLLLEGGATEAFAEGDVVRFADGETHGLMNSVSTEFVYLSVTSPPLNFRSAYAADWEAKQNDAQ